jgi:hypothetical protein
MDGPLVKRHRRIAQLQSATAIEVDMRLALKRHPDSRCEAVARIEVEVLRPSASNLVLHYFVAGKISDLRIPRVTAPTRSDELWRHTCFEAFLQAPHSPAYYEINLAPSLRWAAYRFGGYRSEMVIADELDAPQFETTSNSACFDLKACLELSRLPDFANNAPWRLGLSVVIEETSGATSYWALKHPAGKPDFHRSDCFAHEIPPAS